MGLGSQTSGGRTQENGTTRSEYVVPSIISKENGVCSRQESYGGSSKSRYIGVIMASLLCTVSLPFRILLTLISFAFFQGPIEVMYSGDVVVF